MKTEVDESNVILSKRERNSFNRRKTQQKSHLWVEPLLFHSRSSFMLSNTIHSSLAKNQKISHAYTLNEFTYGKQAQLVLA